MINAKELMIGDIISLNGEPHRVRGLNKDNLGKLEALDGIPVSLLSDSTSFWEPIPLTADILVNNGWNCCDDYEPDDTQYECDYGDYTFTWWCNTYLLNCYYENIENQLTYEMIREMPIKYVHELQHVFTLLGINTDLKV